MQPITYASAYELPPGAARVAATRLAAWLPAGQVALIGEATVAIEGALANYGIPALRGGHLSTDVRAAVVTLEHCEEGSEQVFERLAAQLEGLQVPVCLIVAGGNAASGSRAFWEGAMMALGWRKHPLNEVLAPYGELDRVHGMLLAGFERVPAAALAAYSLQTLVEERDLHTDMTREPGRRSDAHMVRYAQAARFVRPGDRVVDVACGLGYGSYLIAHNSKAASLVGLDSSDSAVRYAQLNFAESSPAPMTFMVGDAEKLEGIGDESAEFAVSVETLEHLREPDRLLAELFRVLVPGGRVYVSVPNDWADETGKDPNPFHFHVYDWAKLAEQLRRNGFEIEKAWLQDAGGGQKRHLSARSMLEIDPERGPSCDGEWLLVLARKAKTGDGEIPSTLDRVRRALATGHLDDAVTLAKASDSIIQSAMAHALVGWSRLAGESAGAIEYWKDALQFARAALADSSSEEQAAGILQLAAAALRELAEERKTPGIFGRLQSTHAGTLRLLLGESPTQDDLNDRAVVAGSAYGDEVLSMNGAEVQRLTTAKDWLDAKYHEHLEKISDLESYTLELERARKWLDDQYHALSAEVKRLSGGVGR